MIYKTKKIALFIPSLRGGGAERVTVLLANELVSLGVSVDLVVCEPKGTYLSAISPNVKVIGLEVTRVSRSLTGLIKYLRQERPDALISAMTHANVISIIAKYLSRVRTQLLIVEHNTFSKSKNSTNSFTDRVLALLVKWLYPFADRVAGVSTGVADDLSKAVGLPRNRIVVLYNPVVSLNLLELAKQPVNESWLSNWDGPVFIAVGRLTDQKDFDLLIKAFSKVQESITARLIILGEGELRDSLEALICELGLEDSVLMPGFVANPFAFIKRSSAFVLSSRWEGLPTALIEAMACGTPVISTDCPSGPAEILEGGKWGRLVPVGDENALVAAMLETITEINPPSVIDRAKDFGVSQSAQRYLTLLDFGG